MTHRNSLSAALVLGSAAAVLLAGTGTARATRDASSETPHASPTPTSGDAVDKARVGVEKAGEKIKEGAEKTGEAIKDAAHDVKEKVAPAAHEAKENAKPVAKEVGQKVKEGARKTGDALDATKQHLDIKTALLADKTVDASHIDVDVDKDTKVVYLRGTVPSAAQKIAAERIARAKASDYIVRNELSVMVPPRKR
jgi:osmotically-inducible protein OsmY